MMGENTSLEALAVELPEDIARAREHGDLELAARMIDRRVQKNIPDALRQRLLLEKEILSLLPERYPYSWEEALREAKSVFRGFRDEELETYLEEGALEWIYLNGERRVKNDFIANLIKTREELAGRLFDDRRLDGKRSFFRVLDEAVARMKKQQTVRCHFRIRSTVTVNEASERPGKRIQVQLPVPVEYSQVRDFRLLHCEPENAVLAPGQYPQRTVCLESVYRTGQKFSIEYTFETEMKYWDWKKAMEERRAAEEAETGKNGETAEEAEAVKNREAAKEQETGKGRENAADGGQQEAGGGASGFLGEQLPHIRFTPYLKALTGEVTGDEKDPLKKAKRIYDFITTRVMYSYVRSYFTIPQQVTFAGTSLKGDCGLQALLFITMCRIAGVPARWQSGLYANPLEIGCHDWAQFYAEPYGWLYVDCSFGGAAYRAGDMERWDFFFGNLEPYRLPAASEYQHEFYCPKKYRRADPYDNQMGEAEYEDEQLLHGRDFETEHEVLEIWTD